VIIPSIVILQSWLATLKRGDYHGTVPSAFGVVFAAFFVVALVFQVAFSLPALSEWIYGSQAGYGAWLNQVWSVGAFGGFAALLFWFPKMTGRSFDAPKARLALGMLAIGTGLQLFALFSLGVDGFPREVSTYTTGYEFRNSLALVGVLIAAFRQRSLARRNTRVVRAFAAADQQLRRDPRSLQRSTADRPARADRNRHRRTRRLGRAVPDLRSAVTARIEALSLR
jgi:heme/copper-type cytochrome/quinol oxidase subunit 1